MFSQQTQIYSLIFLGIFAIPFIISFLVANREEKQTKNIEQIIYFISRERKNLKRIMFLNDSRPALGLEEL